MALAGVISSLLSVGAKLLPAVKDQTNQNQNQIEAELRKLMGMLERIKATLYDSEQREIRDMAVHLWLKELRGVAYDAEDVLDEYHYEVLRAQVETMEASSADSRKRKLIQIPDGMFDQIQQIRNKFSEIEKDQIALRLFEEDGPRHHSSEWQTAPTSHVIDPSGIFGREREKEKLIDLLTSRSHEDKVVSVVTIVGTGGLGKTTLAQLAYNDLKARQMYDKFGWVCVSDDFNVERLMRELVESVTGKTCGLQNLSALQEKIVEVVRGKRVLIVFDDVWNEKRSLWELLQVPFMSAAFAKILVTTRNAHVARIMQTEPTFNLDYLSEEQCWRLFKYYAFGVNQSEASNLVQIGKQIVKKCGMLPLAVKSIASLLRHEAQEESWKEILESELWESDASNDIFPPLQLSYAHLPAYLKPCLVYCSMFPKDYCYNIKNVVRLWISQGYIESKGKKNAEEIGWEYAKQLWQRSFFAAINGENKIRSRFKLHDMVHDLARLNFENKGCSMEVGIPGKIPAFPIRTYHLYIDGFEKLVEPVLFDNFTTLRTLVTRGLGVNKILSTFDLAVAQKLRALEIESCNHELEFISSLSNLKYLRYLLLGSLPFERLPECICSLYNLQILKLTNCAFNELPKSIGNLVSLENLVISRYYNLRMLPESLSQLKTLKNLNLSWCGQLEMLPTSIGNLVSLENIEIKHCGLLKGLPESLCQLKGLKKLILFDCPALEVLPSDMWSTTNLQTLGIVGTGVGSLPPSWDKIISVHTLGVALNCKTIGWLKDFSDIGGTLSLSGLKNVPSLTHFQHANLLSMHNLECLRLCWNNADKDSNGIYLIFKSNQNKFIYQNDSAVMAGLQPHPNLRKLRIDGYCSITFAEWVGNPISCASLEKLVIYDCKNLTFLPFGSLNKLKCLRISSCDSLQFVRAESLPPELQELTIFDCSELISVPGIQKLKSLVKLSITRCSNLHWLVMTDDTSVGLIMQADQSSSQNSLFELRNINSLRSLRILWCPKLQLLGSELLCSEFCEVEVGDCPLVMEWCLQHSINYKDIPPWDIHCKKFDNICFNSPYTL